jgi:short subunit dehydrogenase-like uncharacterized protein
MDRSTIADREYDIVLYGATGFVGSRAAAYLANHPQREQLRWAIAGRDQSKLEQVKQHLGAAASSVSVLVADSGNQEAVDTMVAKTQVLINTAGPFALYGSPIVDACVRLKTHYVDITGETTWVRGLIDHYHDCAAADGTRIIPSCGFDSVPSDLGCYLMVRHIQDSLGVPCVEVKAYYQMYGGFNGGTIASDIHRHESGQIERGRDLFLLNPSDAYPLAEVDLDRDPVYPSFDRDLGTWVGSFIMGAINTRVVRRSAALFEQWGQPYSPHFHYQEYTKYNPPFAYAKSVFVTGLMAGFEAALDLPFSRNLLKPLLPKPGSGPSEQTMNSGWFTTELLGTSIDGQKVRGMIRYQGDPGNRATLCCVCESALSLALNVEELPGGRERGGLLTPATGLGDVLVKRLREAGMSIKIDPNLVSQKNDLAVAAGT